jgi:predicted RecB family nuclease
MTEPTITRAVLEGYLHCRYLGHLRLTGHEAPRSEYEEMVYQANLEQKLKAFNKLRRNAQDDIVTGVELTRAELRKGPSYILDATLLHGAFDIQFECLKKVDGHSDLGPYHYVPVLFSGSHNIHKFERLLLETLGALLGHVQGRPPARGIVYYDRQCTPESVRLANELRAGEDAVRDLARMQRDLAPPKLLLNDHCHVCEFQKQCRAQAIKEDNLTLLRGIREEELKRYTRRGLFTLTQLAHTFRPRRPGKRDAPSRVRHHGLQAVAIRDKTVYVFGTPDIPSSTTEIYLDMEGKPDEQFVYLIGVLVCRGKHVETRSFWANGKDDELAILNSLLGLLEQHKGARVYCYGSYEKAFLKRMRKNLRRKKAVDSALQSLVNVLSVIYAHFYFPTYSNGLKEIAALLGFSWTVENASGIQSIVWRAHWETTGNEEWKTKLLRYNIEDCHALRRVAEFLRAASLGRTSASETILSGDLPGPRIISVRELEGARSAVRWAKYADADLDFINKCSYFEYQRERVSARENPTLRRRYNRRRESRNRSVRVSQRILITSSKCPACGGANLVPIIKRKREMGSASRVKRAFDLRITKAGIRRRVIEVRATMYQCRDCGQYFTPAQYDRLSRYFHGLMSWVLYQHVEHRISMRVIQKIGLDLFGLSLHAGELMSMRSLMARYYRHTFRQLQRKRISSPVLHADETEVKLRDTKGYVWVFANAEVVIYVFRPTREGQFLPKMLKDFHGVLVSDFYAVYDALQCSQQKCLIHLIRDINQDIVSNPYDLDLRGITERFGKLLRSIVTTVDKHGLKRRYLQRHAGPISAFFESLSGQTFGSEPARALQARLLKNRDRLFTFIEHDGVSWNNNNAENAIRQFSYFRERLAAQMSETGLSEHLLLLSICQTCRYKGISFLDFLLSKQQDIDRFGVARRARRASKVELLPKGFVPPHLAGVRPLNDGGRGRRRLEKYI